MVDIGEERWVQQQAKWQKWLAGTDKDLLFILNTKRIAGLKGDTFELPFDHKNRVSKFQLISFEY